MTLNFADLLPAMGQNWQRAPVWVARLLWLAVIWYLAKILWAMVPNPTSQTLLPAAQTGLIQNLDAASQSGFDLDPSLQAGWFGTYDPNQNTPTLVEDDFEETSLSLTLMGTLATSNPEFGYALVKDERNTEKKYGVGDRVSRQAKLHAVYPKKIVLNRNGALEELRLPEAQDAATGKRPNTRANTSARTQSKQTTFNTDIIKLSEVITHRPHYNSEGQFQGIKVFAGKQRKAFIQSGLRPGDIITSINGKSFDSLKQAATALLQLPTDGTVSLAIQRNQREMNLDFSPSSILDKVAQTP